jgi:hypothetical protein
MTPRQNPLRAAAATGNEIDLEKARAGVVHWAKVRIGISRFVAAPCAIAASAQAGLDGGGRSLPCDEGR